MYKVSSGDCKLELVKVLSDVCGQESWAQDVRDEEYVSQILKILDPSRKGGLL